MRSDSPPASDRPQLHTHIGNATACDRALTRRANSGGRSDDYHHADNEDGIARYDFFADSLTCRRDTCNPFHGEKFTGICDGENLRRGSRTRVHDPSFSIFHSRCCYQTEGYFSRCDSSRTMIRWIMLHS